LLNQQSTIEYPASQQELNRASIARANEQPSCQELFQPGQPSACNELDVLARDGIDQVGARCRVRPKSGNRELGLEYFTKSAIAGQTEALSSFTWYSLKNGNYDDAITLYKACRVKLKFGDTPYQLANCDSNFWLNNLAIGGSEKDAEKAWLINGAKSNHTESLFFPIVLMHKAGNIKLRDEYASKLNKQQWKAMSDEMLEEQMTSTGWFKKWCHDSYEMIVELGKN
jgi:hypothetical protein